MKYRNPYIDTRGKVCTIEIDLVKFDVLSKSQPSLMLFEDKQIQLKDKVVAGSPEATKGTVSKTALEADGLLKKIGCDHLTVREVEQDIFGGKIEILVPKQ